jgi:hypothetical protein
MKTHLQAMAKMVLCLFAPYAIFAQSPPIEVEFWKDTDKVIVVKLEVILSKSKDKFEVIEPNKFIIPDSLTKTKNSVVLVINDMALEFDEIPLAWVSDLPKWKIKLDVQPVDFTEYSYIRRRKKIKWLYYLENGLGGRITEYRFTKPLMK